QRLLRNYRAPRHAAHELRPSTRVHVRPTSHPLPSRRQERTPCDRRPPGVVNRSPTGIRTSPRLCYQSAERPPHPPSPKPPNPKAQPSPKPRPPTPPELENPTPTPTLAGQSPTEGCRSKSQPMVGGSGGRSPSGRGSGGLAPRR